VCVCFFFFPSFLPFFLLFLSFLPSLNHSVIMLNTYDISYVIH
jgi:hypothetical protein